jgi:hypothetical protein
VIKTVEFEKADLRKVAFDVLCNDVVVLKKAVPPEMVRESVSALHDWSKMAPQTKGHPLQAGGATHLISYLPARSESRYIAHDYLFDFSIGAPITTNVTPVFERLRQIYNGLLGEQFEFGKTYDGVSFLPQVIQYPRGGGFFQEHFHPIRPQIIGLVLSGSDYGKDFKIGGGRFRDSKGDWVSTEGDHDIGDVTCFRFDIGHDITPIDPDEDLDWTRKDGRWSFVLPLKPIQA